jgi:chemotaxis protein MotA
MAAGLTLPSAELSNVERKRRQNGGCEAASHGALMDIATGVGLLAGVATVIVIILIDGGNFAAYFDKHAVIIIFGGAVAATMVRFPFSVILHGLPMGIRFAFNLRSTHPRDLIGEITQVAELVRKNGPMALENVQVEDTFLAQGLRYVADGYDRDFIKDTMERDRDIFLMHLEEGSKVYRAIGDCAPAWGMVGTILGMVTMFANMSDPSKLGPAMATALLATLYGAVIANLVALPIADKLHVKLEEENVSRSLIIDGILLIRESKSPSLVREMLVSYLPEHTRAELLEA